MIIGVPREIKAGEGRVALTPDTVKALVAAGNVLRVQAGAGAAAGFADTAYAEAGAELVASAAQAFDAELVVNVKEIQDGEWQHLRAGGMLFSFLHLGADHAMARALLNRRITGIAFETVRDKDGGLPILAPMSALAGELAPSIAARLQGRSGATSLRDVAVLIVGAGAAGSAAARAAIALGARVTIVAQSDRRLAPLRAEFGAAIRTVTMAGINLPKQARETEALIAAINVAGAATPKLLTRPAIAGMRAGAVLIANCIDGGGIAETSHPTTLAAPSYVEEGVIHYCVPNMPAGTPRVASEKLAAALLPYLQSLTEQGLLRAMRDNEGLAAGLQMHGGSITQREVAAQLGLPFLDLDAVLFSC